MHSFSMDLDYDDSNLYHYTSNFGSFGYGAAKGMVKQLVPAVYAFGVINGVNGLGLAGLAANCLNVSLCLRDTVKSFFYLAKNVRKLINHKITPEAKKPNCLKIAQNIHQIIVSLAMVNTIFVPTPLANVIVSAEIFRVGLISISKGLAHMKKSLNINPDGVNEWAGIGESLVTIIFSVHNCTQGAFKLASQLEQKKINVKVWKVGKPRFERSEEKHAVEMVATWDHNGVFNYRKELNHYNIYTIYTSKVNSEQEMCNVLREARKIAGKPLDAAYIGAHGNMRGILLQAGQTVTTTNVETIAGCLKETLSVEAPIFLNSCNTAKARAGNRLNFAERLAGETEHLVFASTFASTEDECRIYEAEYGSKLPIIYSCIVDDDRKDRKSELESALPLLNPATPHKYEYNRFIKRTKDVRDDITARDDRFYTFFCNRISELVPVDAWSALAETQMWEDLNKWWEKV